MKTVTIAMLIPTAAAYKTKVFQEGWESRISGV